MRDEERAAEEAQYRRQMLRDIGIGFALVFAAFAVGTPLVILWAMWLRFLLALLEPGTG
jgi:hypothetical protein